MSSSIYLTHLLVTSADEILHALRRFESMLGSREGTARPSLDEYFI